MLPEFLRLKRMTAADLETLVDEEIDNFFWEYLRWKRTIIAMTLPQSIEVLILKIRRKLAEEDAEDACASGHTV
jgi:hypothetical protein